MNNLSTAMKQTIQSNKRLIELHAELNAELEKFNTYLCKMKQRDVLEQLQSVQEKQQILAKIHDINARIQSLALTRPKQSIPSQRNCRLTSALSSPNVSQPAVAIQ